MISSYREAVVLNNEGTSLLAKGEYSRATETLKAAVCAAKRTLDDDRAVVTNTPSSVSARGGARAGNGIAGSAGGAARSESADGLRVVTMTSSSTGKGCKSGVSNRITGSTTEPSRSESAGGSHRVYVYSDQDIQVPRADAIRNGSSTWEACAIRIDNFDTEEDQDRRDIDLSSAIMLYNLGMATLSRATAGHQDLISSPLIACALKTFYLAQTILVKHYPSATNVFRQKHCLYVSALTIRNIRYLLQVQNKITEASTAETSFLRIVEAIQNIEEQEVFAAKGGNPASAA